MTWLNKPQPSFRGPSEAREPGIYIPGCWFGSKSPGLYPRAPAFGRPRDNAVRGARLRTDLLIKQPDADMRHRPVQTGCRATLSINHVTSTSITTSRKGGAVHREDGLVPTSAVARRGPASSLDLECGPPLGAPWPGRFEEAFRRSAPNSAVGPRRCNLFRTLRHLLARWGLLVQLPHFRLPPALAGLRLLLRSYPRPSATRNRFPQAPHSHSVSGLSSRNAPCENKMNNTFCYYCVNRPLTVHWRPEIAAVPATPARPPSTTSSTPVM